MIRRALLACVLAAAAVVRRHPAAWAGAAGWYAVLVAGALHGSFVLDVVRTSVAQVEESVGITVLVPPDAAGLSALGRAIERLPGVRDATFVIPSAPVGAASDTSQPLPALPSLYVRTRSSLPESVEALAVLIRSLPHVEAAVFHPGMVARARGARVAVDRLIRAARIVAVFMLIVALWVPGTGLVRAEQRSAVVLYALGVSRLAASAPAALAGAVAGAAGGSLAWAAVWAVRASGGQIRVDAETAAAFVLGAIVLGAAGPLVQIHRSLGGRRPARVEGAAR